MPRPRIYSNNKCQKGNEYIICLDLILAKEYRNFGTLRAWIKLHLNKKKMQSVNPFYKNLICLCNITIVFPKRQPFQLYERVRKGKVVANVGENRKGTGELNREKGYFFSFCKQKLENENALGYGLHKNLSFFNPGIVFVNVAPSRLYCVETRPTKGAKHQRFTN